MSWKGGKGGRKVKWQGRRDGRVVRWQVEKGGRVVKWQGGRFLVVFKGGGRRVTPRFHLFVSDVDQKNDCIGWVKDDLA